MGAVAAWSFLSPDERHSVLLITLDTTRADHLGCYDPSRAKTPRIDALAAEGVLFRQADSVAPITLPSHTSMLTGVFPPDHGVRNNGFYRLSREVVTLPERLAKQGYRTGAFVSSVILDHKYGLKQGFEVYDDRFEAPLDVGNRFPVSRRAKETVGKAVDWLAGLEDDDPFFMWAHFYDPHAPYDPPAPFDRAYPDSPYMGEIAYMDYQLEGLLAAARARAGEKLVVIVVGDHGESLGEHGEQTHGFFVYQSTIHVPLVVSGGPFTGGVEVDEPVRTVDIFPTVMELAGLTAPPEIRGRSLAGVLHGEVMNLTTYSEAWIPLSFGWSGLRSARQAGRKVIEGSRATVLDLVADPEEAAEVAAADTGDTGALLTWLKRTRLPLLDVGADAIVEQSEADVKALVGLGYLNAAGGAPGMRAEVVDPELGDPRDRLDVYRLLQRARSAAGDGHSEAALTLISKAVAEDPVNPQMRMERAQIMIRLGQEEKALPDLQFASEHITDDPRAANLLGKYHHQAGRLDQAEAAFRLALTRSPEHYQSRFHLGSVLLDQTRYQEAVAIYRRLLLAQPKDARAMNNMAFALLRGDFDREEGFRLLLQAVDAAPRDARIRLSVADALIRDGRPEEAVPHIERARKLLGDHPDVLEMMERAGLPAGK
jgi:arylsulfatase A-like enzyme/Flp pilus assembly protein TadD